jgi:hypothetical protein
MPVASLRCKIRGIYAADRSILAYSHVESKYDFYEAIITCLTVINHSCTI